MKKVFAYLASEHYTIFDLAAVCVFAILADKGYALWGLLAYPASSVLKLAVKRLRDRSV